MAKKSQYLVFILFIVFILCTMIIYLLPFFLSIFYNTKTSTLWEDDSFGIISALSRTIMFSFLSSWLNTIVALQLAILIRNIPISSKTGSMLSVLIVPIILGNVTISYVFKTLLYGSAIYNFIINERGMLQLLSLLFIQFWQYGLPFTYLFWLCIKQIPEKKYSYAYSVLMTEREIVRDIILPSTKNLFILLFFISFIFSFFESSKSLFVFKTSQGTGTEFMCQALYRVYQSFSISNPSLSNVIALKSGIWLTLCVLVILFLCGCIIVYMFSKLCRQSSYFILKSYNKSKVVSFICIAIVLLPIFITIIKSNYDFSFGLLSQMVIPLILTIISAAFATTISILFGVATRIVFSSELDGFAAKSLFFFLFIFLLQIVPPLCVVVCGYHWMSIVGYNEFTNYIIWICGHPILIFPVLGSFVIATHFVVKYKEIDWITVHKLTNRDIVKYSFWMRFYKDYILTYIFAFAFIWNDETINKILSDEIPSFADKLQRLFIGRATDDALAAFYALIAFALAFISIIMWKHILKHFVIVK